MRIERAGLRLQAGRDFELVRPGGRPALSQLLGDLPRADGRAQGVTPEIGEGGGAALEHADRAR